MKMLLPYWMNQTIHVQLQLLLSIEFDNGHYDALPVTITGL
jgi:hypothetical protein